MYDDYDEPLRELDRMEAQIVTADSEAKDRRVAAYIEAADAGILGALFPPIPLAVRIAMARNQPVIGA